MGVQRGLPVVDPALRHERDQIVGIEIDGIGVGRRNIIAQPPKYQPWARPDEVLARNGGKRLRQARIDDACRGKDLFGVGRTDAAEFGLRIPFIYPPFPVCYTSDV